MARDQKLDVLHSIPLFARFGQRELLRLGQLVDEIDVPAGRVLMRQGATADEMFVVISGTLRVERDGRLIAELGSGDWAGEMGLLSEEPRMATVTAQTASRLLVVGHREFHALMDELPSVRNCILAALTDRIQSLEPEAAH